MKDYEERHSSIDSSNILVDSFVIKRDPHLFVRGEVRVQAANSIPRPVLIICHGFKGFKDWGSFPYIAEWFALQGFYTISFNFSGSGVHITDFDELDQFGDNTYSQEQEDLEQVLQQLLTGTLPLASYANQGQVALLGHSRGGGNSIIFAAEHETIRAVVTWNGIAHPNLFDPAFEEEARLNGVAYTPNARTKQQMPIRARFFEDLEQNEARFHIPARLAELSIPALIIQGTADSERILRGFSQLKQAAPAQSFIEVPGANHTFGAVHPFAGTTPELESVLQDTKEFLCRSL